MRPHAAPDRSWPDAVVEQDGVLTRRQALPGVVVTHAGLVTVQQQCWAAVLVAGSGACLSGDAALTAAGMPLGDLAVLNVAVPEDRVVVSRVLATSVRVVPRRVRALDAWRHPARTPPTVRLPAAVLHAAAWAPSDRAAQWRVAAAVQQRRVTAADLRRALAAELDGAHHRTARAWESDLLRANDLLVAGRQDGTVLLRFTTGNLRHDGARVAAQLAAVLR